MLNEFKFKVLMAYFFRGGRKVQSLEPKMDALIKGKFPGEILSFGSFCCVLFYNEFK